MKIAKVCPSPSDELIRSFEQSFRIKLPASYRNFLRSSNGAIPLGGAVFPLGSTERVVERFLALLDSPRDAGTDGWYDIAVVTTQIGSRLRSRDDIVGYDVVPIAALFAGDFVCLDFRMPGEPSVVVWYHEESDELAPVFEYVAPTFSEWLAMLSEVPGDPARE